MRSSSFEMPLVGARGCLRSTAGSKTPPAAGESRDLQTKFESKMTARFTLRNSILQQSLNYPASDRAGRQGLQETVQRLDGRLVGNAVHPRRAEMALEGLYRHSRLLVEQPIDFQAISVKRQHRLEGLDRLSGIAHRQKSSAAHGRWLDIVTDAAFGEPGPWKLLAGVDLAARRNVGVCKNPLRRNRPSCANVAGK